MYDAGIYAAFGAESFVFHVAIQKFKDQNILNYNVTLPVVLYGCETWSLTLREERKLRVFENMVLRRISEPRRNEVRREWRRLHNEELNVLVPLTRYSAGDKIGKNEMGWTCGACG